MPEKNCIDIKENELLKIDKELLELLLQDKTTGRNIIWATDNYSKHGVQYAFEKPILIELVTSRNGSIIKPRTQKSKTEQQQRVRQKAEVFTPSWICNVQNNLVDEVWFGRKNVFDIEENRSWKTIKEKIIFPETENRNWKDYVCSTRLEITCGEAPYITSRYDTVTGQYIEVPERIGFLDRKLRVVNENTESREDWLKWACAAVQSSYGFEWQGDNVLIARENVLFTVAEHYHHKFNESLPAKDLVGFAKIIVWNIWQMDGLKFVVPNSCTEKEVIEQDLFETRIISKACEGCKKNNSLKHNGIYCKIKDWKKNEIVRFVDLINGGELYGNI